MDISCTGDGVGITTNEHEGAEHNHEEHLWEKLKTSEGVEKASVLSDLAHMSHHKAQWKEAVTFAETAVDIYLAQTESYDQTDLAQVYLGMAYALHKLDRNDEAVVKAQAACALFAKIDSPRLFMAQRNLGVFLNEAGQFEEAARSFREIIKTRPFDDEEIYLGKDLFNLGNALEKLEQYDEAIDLLMQARTIAKTHSAIGLALLCDASLALCYLQTSRIDEAISSATLAVERARLSENHKVIMEAQTIRARGYIAQKNYDQALFDLKGGKDLYIKNECDPTWSLVIDAEALIAEIFELQGDEERARETRSRIALITESSM